MLPAAGRRRRSGVDLDDDDCYDYFYDEEGNVVKLLEDDAPFYCTEQA